MYSVNQTYSGDVASASLKDYITLLKPRVMSLVVFTGLAGVLIAPGHLHPFLAFVAVVCIAVASGAAGAINMWYDRDIDAIMFRTRNRPIPAGRIAPETALEFGVVFSFFAVLVMGLATNWLAALLLASASAFYVFVYTIWLKRRTPQNIVIGGAAGAFPPLIGWVAVTGQLHWVPLVLFALIFLWTPPHFWSLALVRSQDYARAKVPMLPVVAGVYTTKVQILIYTFALVVVSLIPWLSGFSGPVYGVGAGLLGLVFLGQGVRVWYDQGPSAAKKMFGFSIVYLFGVFALMVVDNVLRGAGG